MNLVFHISEDGSEIKLNLFLTNLFFFLAAVLRTSIGGNRMVFLLFKWT